MYSVVPTQRVQGWSYKILMGIMLSKMISYTLFISYASAFKEIIEILKYRKICVNFMAIGAKKKPFFMEDLCERSVSSKT